MSNADALLAKLASDTVDPTPELFAAIAASPESVAALVALLERAAKTPAALTKSEINLVSWAAYVFAENGAPRLAAPLLALGDLREDDVRPLLGAYADHDLPVILLRLAGAKAGVVFEPLIQTYRGAAEVRIAPIFAAGAAWAHGLISRAEGVAPLRAELERLANDAYAEAQDDEWFDTVLDAVLGLHPAGMEDELEELREYWGLEGDWDDELDAAFAETEEEVKARLRDTFPLLTRATQFIERWDAIDAEEDN